MEKQFTITRTPLVQRIKSAFWRWNCRARMNFTRRERVASYIAPNRIINL
jgi:hypothetical protein